MFWEQNEGIFLPQAYQNMWLRTVRYEGGSPVDISSNVNMPHIYTFPGNYLYNKLISFLSGSRILFKQGSISISENVLGIEVSYNIKDLCFFEIKIS